MHEVSLVEDIRAIIMDQARSHAFSRVTRIRLEIGRFAGVEKAALAFAWDAVMQDSPAQGAILQIIDLPGQATCLDCSQTVQINDRFDPCPLCGGENLLPTGGTDMRIKDIEVV